MSTNEARTDRMTADDAALIGRSPPAWAVDLLTTLKRCSAIDADMTERVFSAAMRPHLEAWLRERFGKLAAYPRIERLWRKCRRWQTSRWQLNEPRLPAFDHELLYRDAKGDHVFISQPYGLSHDALREMLAFAEENGIQISVRTGSPHFAARCLLVTAQTLRAHKGAIAKCDP